MRSICVFCGSNPGHRPEYMDLARETGRLIAERQLTLVYGGGKVGLMGALADSALAAGGRVVGIIPQMLLEREAGHRGLTDLRVVSTLSERKFQMGVMSDAFLTLPGGIGTMDELFEAWSWAQLGLHKKPSGLLNFRGYYDHLVQYLDLAVSEGFQQAQHRAALLVGTEVGPLLDQLQAAAKIAPAA
ncbi:TIGR00730 family Rossman fold protein [Steroidobacter flavus]|uniref:Cytokinin riboside 5'-monophosphate phosphoribohydrolase n=1 Tax=Steroidobacter flavus TaxID=1842136 RepID=A0ABV8SS49_9GAMM